MLPREWCWFVHISSDEGHLCKFTSIQYPNCYSASLYTIIHILQLECKPVITFHFTLRFKLCSPVVLSVGFSLLPRMFLQGFVLVSEYWKLDALLISYIHFDFYSLPHTRDTFWREEPWHGRCRLWFTKGLWCWDFIKCCITLQAILIFHKDLVAFPKVAILVNLHHQDNLECVCISFVR